MIAVLLGVALVFFMFPRKEDERRLLAEYQRQDTSSGIGRRVVMRGTDRLPIAAPEPTIARAQTPVFATTLPLASASLSA